MTESQPHIGIFLGLDIGSISLNTVVMDRNENILENHYDFCHGQPFLVLKSDYQICCHVTHLNISKM
jgi:activator of 2-hydroxyglutaryl-CoA dehydratase